MQDINLKSVYLCCRAALRHMVPAQKGSIINTASFVAVMGSATSQISYTASKGGVLAMSRELGVQFARQGIRVNALCPGPVNTPLLQELFAKDPERAARRLVHVPMGRFAEPEELAAAVAFLASDDASFITGVDLPGRRRHQPATTSPRCRACQLDGRPIRNRPSSRLPRPCCVRCGPATRFEDTVGRLLQTIRLGVLAPGESLPPERELAARLGVSRDTVREAIKSLADAGYLVSRRGRYGGTFLADDAARADRRRGAGQPRRDRRRAAAAGDPRGRRGPDGRRAAR